MSRNNDYTTGNLLDFSNLQKYYKLIGTYLWRQTNMGNLLIYFTGKLGEDGGATMSSIPEK